MESDGPIYLASTQQKICFMVKYFIHYLETTNLMHYSHKGAYISRNKRKHRGHSLSPINSGIYNGGGQEPFVE